MNSDQNAAGVVRRKPRHATALVLVLIALALSLLLSVPQMLLMSLVQR